MLINKLNKDDWNKDYFDIFIPLIDNKTTNYRISSLPSFYTKTTPKPGLCNLMINLTYSKPVEVMGPNNFYYRSNIGYFNLNNIQDGQYTIIQNNKKNIFNIFTNDTTYINNLE